MPRLEWPLPPSGCVGSACRRCAWCSRSPGYWGVVDYAATVAWRFFNQLAFACVNKPPWDPVSLGTHSGNSSRFSSARWCLLPRTKFVFRGNVSNKLINDASPVSLVFCWFFFPPKIEAGEEKKKGQFGWQFGVSSGVKITL